MNGFPSSFCFNVSSRFFNFSLYFNSISNVFIKIIIAQDSLKGANKQTHIDFALRFHDEFAGKNVFVFEHISFEWCL